jgi:hypothetical protein
MNMDAHGTVSPRPLHHLGPRIRDTESALGTRRMWWMLGTRGWAALGMLIALAVASLGNAVARAGQPAIASGDDAAVVLGDTGLCFIMGPHGEFVNAHRSNLVSLTFNVTDAEITATCVTNIGSPETIHFDALNTGKPCSVVVDGQIISTRDWWEDFDATGSTVTCRAPSGT